MISLQRTVLSLIAASFLLISGDGFATAEALPPVDPVACVIEPIEQPLIGPEGDLNEPVPTPTPIAVETAVAADPDTAAAVTDRIAQAIACRNAGDILRMLANFTDAWVAERFTGYDLVFYRRFIDAAASPAPQPESDWIGLISIEAIRIRDDGAALATVRTSRHDVEQVSLLLLIEENGQWLIAGGEIASVE